ncbi:MULTISPECIES: hypothetical protein [unclassified Rathayibacter]|uniref:hypothetical protein n=1 Tax=unclassified Rathayibacter TaxID=2609250 RepID=UPI001FB4B9AB|nr:MULTISPECIES: hypothetical protein [unclassified Rathayibacter]MCJ1674727.1 hypothetical protein [Rathayibacter sp. VKM Ac-2929]MCJ1685278.1 hypothetical protein [Rathayibacter sp. VKM Ac-2928]
MKTHLVDPRNVDGEVDNPVYRVYSTEAETIEEEIRFIEARDVLEVIEWAERDARGLPFRLYLEHPSAFNSGKATLELLFSR